jgi:hypothetical protein
LRYSVSKQTANAANTDDYTEVAVDTVFRSGESIRLNIKSNDDAYLYIVTQGSSGTWSLLFPSAKIDNGNNRVQAHRDTVVPGEGRFKFDERAGDERLFIVLTREPESDLEQLIYSLRQPQPTAAPVDEPRRLMAQLTSIDNDVIGKIRSSVRARDLVFETVVNDPSARKEKAAYVVNTTGALNSRVVADLNLKHIK